jgi:hypothetical protein
MGCEVKRLLVLVSALAFLSSVAPTSLPNLPKTSEAKRYIEEPRLSSTEFEAASLVVDNSIPLTSAFQLHSHPGSKRVIYLDFNGYDLTGTKWSTDSRFSFNSSNKVLEPFDLDGNSSTFNDAELRAVIETWSSVSEDYSIFDVDVTTEQPTEENQWRTSDLDDRYGVIAAVTTENNPISAVCGCGGIAWSKVFDRTWRSYNGLSTNYMQPALVFTQSFYPGRVIADIVSHEVGHNLGLYHDGYNNPVQDYYDGREGWGPIMGSPYEMPLSTWSNGDYRWANQLQDDISEIVRYGLPLLQDDFANTTSKAKSVKSSSETAGVINSRNDVDVFSFVATKTQTNVSVFSNSVSTNLDLKLSVSDSAGKLIRIDSQPFVKVDSNSATGLDAKLNLATKVGSKYFITIDGVGEGDPLTTGYSDYGSVGAYVMKIESVTLPALVVTAPIVSGSNLIGSTLNAEVGNLPAGATYTAQWLSNGVLQQVSGLSYQIRPQDQSATITFNLVVQATGYRVVSVSSSGLKVVGAISPAPKPTITGKAKVGSTLTAKPGTWKSGTNLSYQWFRDGVEIANQTGSTYTVVEADFGKRLLVKVTGNLSGYNPLAKSSSPTGKAVH